MKLSIIIPIYNVEKYIERCLNSLISQLTDEVELILVDDGSKDRSGDIAKRFSNDKNIKYIWKENGGVSSAKNLGIEFVQGDYTTFVDSDDFVSENYVSTVLNALSAYDLDVLCFNYFIKFDDREYVEFHYKDKKLDLNDHGGFDWYLKLDQDEYIRRACWNKVYKTQIIRDHQIRFPLNQTVGEDFMFNVDFFEYVRSLKIMDAPLYYYYQRPNSVMNTYNIFYTRDILNYANILKSVALKSGYLFLDDAIPRLLIKSWFGVINQEANCSDSLVASKNLDLFLLDENLKKIKKVEYSTLSKKHKFFKFLYSCHLSRFVYRMIKMKK